MYLGSISHSEKWTPGSIFRYGKWTPGVVNGLPGGPYIIMKYVPRSIFHSEKWIPRMNVWELTCVVFPSSLLSSAENDSEMQNSGSVEMC